MLDIAPVISRKHFSNCLCFVFIIVMCFQSNAQKNNYWPLGYQSYTISPLVGGMTMDFPNGIRNVYDFPREMWFEQTNAAISSDSGKFLFCSNGIYIENAEGDTMPNSTGLNPSWWTNGSIQGGNNLPQACIIIPKPNDKNIYYLFHETADITGPEFCASYLYCTTIDMQGDSGRGAVISKNKIIITDSLVTGGLTATRHANGRDWWLVAPDYTKPDKGLYTILITPDTIEVTSNQRFGWHSDAPSQCCFSPDGSKYAFSNLWGYIQFFDFDRCAGVFTFLDEVPSPDSTFWIGTSFSPNSRYCYWSHAYNLYQYDMQATSISASQILVAEFDTFSAPNPPWYTLFYLHQIGPDGKIYVNPRTSTMAMHTIDSPDSPGVACNMLQHNILLPHFNLTIPNFPNYDLGPLAGSPCDTLGLLTPALSKRERVVRLAPNPANNSFYIKYDIPTNENLLFILYDSYGKEVLRKNLYGTFKNLLVHTEQLNNGIYFWRALSEPVGRAPLSKWGGAGPAPTAVSGGEVGAQNGKIVILH